MPDHRRGRDVSRWRSRRLRLVLVGTGLVASGLGLAVTMPRLAANPFQTPPQGQSRGEWTLVFSDDFDGDQLDRAVWTTCYWWDDGGCTNLGNNELEWYLPEQVSVRDGILELTADRREVVGFEGRVFPHVSGMVTSGRPDNDTSEPPGFAFQYGYVEIRAKVPTGDGLWPAFWMLPVTHQSKPEIDVMEILGNNPQEFLAHIHWRDGAGESAQAGNSWLGPDFSKGWHTFGVEWNEDVVVWYVDGVERWRFSDVVPHEPMYLIANLAVGGDYPGPPTADTEFPARLEVDHIRVWQRP